MDWADTASAFDSYLKLRTFPLAFKLLTSADDLHKVKGIRSLSYKPRMCQMITLARVHGWTLGATADEPGSPVCASIIGLIEPPQELMAGKILSGIMYKTNQDASQHEKAMLRLPSVKYQAVVIALPAASTDKVLEGLKRLHKGDIRYPIPSWGAQVQAPSLLEKEVLPS